MDDCNQLSIDNDWSLTRKNACHIGVMNSEMGDVKFEMINIKNEIKSIKSFQGVNMAIWGAIGIVLIGLVIKKMWGK